MNSGRRIRLAAVWAACCAGLDARAAAADAPTLSLSAAYEGRVLIKILDLDLRASAGPQHFKSDVHVTSSGVVSFIHRFDVDAGAFGAMAGGRPVPQAYVQHAFDGRKHSARTLIEHGGTLDPASLGLALALAPMTATPCRGAIPIFDGKQRYDVIFTPLGAGRLSPKQQAMGLAQPVRCKFDFRAISGFKAGRAASYRPFVLGDITATFAKVPAHGVWVATEVGAMTLAGPISLQLVQASAQGQRPAATVVPARRQGHAGGRARA